MNTQLNKILFKMIAGEPVSATTVLVKIHKQIEADKSYNEYPALCFARHLLSHIEVSRDSFAYEALIQLLMSFSKMMAEVGDYTPHYNQTISHILPFNLINYDLNKFCIKHCKKPIPPKNQIKFVESFIENIDDETTISFDETKNIYKKMNIEEKLNQILDNQTGSSQIHRFNFLKIKKVMEDKEERVQIHINIDGLDIPPNGLVIREIDNLTIVMTLARIKI